MKKIIFLLCLFVMSSSLYSQSIRGKAIYKTSSVMNISFGPPTSTDSTKTNKVTTVSVVQQDDINKQIRKSMQKEYELLFDKSASLYKEILKLKDLSQEGGVEVVGLGNGTEGKIYKNTQEQLYLENRDVFGKLFLIKDTLHHYDWKITKETKKIGAYTCYKAIAYEVVERTGNKENNTIKLDSTLITAWYTPEIPLSQGPAEYWGLPGFILELNNGRLNIICSEIILNPDEKIKVEKPGKGKKVNTNKFKEIYNEKVKEFVKMYDNKRKKSDSRK